MKKLNEYYSTLLFVKTEMNKEQTNIFIEMEEIDEEEEEEQQPFIDFTITNSLTEEEYIDTQPLFTRYLYIINDVYISLFDSIINGRKKEAVFWAFELYYSGFKHEVWKFIINLYIEYFEKYNSHKIKTFIETKCKEWVCNNNELHHNLATVVSNLCFFNYVINEETKRIINKNIIIYCIYKAEDIKIYETKIPSSKLKNYYILRMVCEYPSIKDYSPYLNIKIMEKYLKNIYSREMLTKIFRNYWEYYSYNTPVWKERIQKSEGILDHKNKKVIFEEEVLQDLFYNNFGYEPDEENIAVFNYCIGK